MKLFYVFAFVSLVHARCIQWNADISVLVTEESWLDYLKADKKVKGLDKEVEDLDDRYRSHELNNQEDELTFSEINAAMAESRKLRTELREAREKQSEAMKELELAYDKAEAVKSSIEKKLKQGQELDSRMVPLCGFGALKDYPYFGGLGYEKNSVVCCDKTASGRARML